MLPGLDVQAASGRVVAPPSLHVFGQRYEWVDEAAPLAQLPKWLLSLIMSKQSNRK